MESDSEHGVSRSGLHRYLKSFGEAAERMREAQQIAGSIAGSIVGRLNETGSGDLRRLLTQLLSQVARSANCARSKARARRHNLASGGWRGL